MDQQRQGLPFWLLAATFSSNFPALYDNTNPTKIEAEREGEGEPEAKVAFEEQ